MKTMKRLLALALVAVMLLSVASCASGPDVEEETTKKKHPIATTTPEPEPNDGDVIDDAMANYWVELVVGGVAQYTIVSEGVEFDAAANRLKEGLKTNTGVDFPIKLSTSNRRVTGQKISVGKNPTLYLNDPTDLTYLGCLSVDRDTTIYLTGWCVEAVGNTVDRFLSGVLLKYKQFDENGDIQVKAPDIRLFFLYNPTNYATTDAKLLNASLSEYVLVLPKEMNATEKLMAKYLLSEIGTNTGCVLKQVTDETEKAAHEIVLGKTNRTESEILYEGLFADSYEVLGKNGSLYVAYDNYLVMSDAREQIHECYMLSDLAIDDE